MTSLALPLRLTQTGELATVEDGSPTDILQRSILVCSTRPGEVSGEPGYGLYEQSGRAGGADLAEVGAQLDRWVPEAAKAIETDPLLLDRALSIVGVKVASR